MGTGQRIDEQGTDGPPEGLYRYDRTANKRVPTTSDVTEEDLGFFQEHGYLVIENLLSQDEIDAALDGMTALLDGTGLDSDVVQFEDELVDELDDPANAPPDVKLDHIRKFMWFAEHSEGMAAPSEKPELLDLLSTLVDGEPEMFQDMALVKPPGGGSEKPWHQDKAYFDVELDAPVVGVWIALDEATAENGCMHVIPGSHRDGPVVHFDRRDWQICDTDVQIDEDVMAPLEPGGALLFDGLLHHGTPPNTSEKRRRALQFHYTAADAEWVDDGHEEFGSEGKDVEC
jgi:phytanoyl-CoA hydroxylase